MLQILMMIQENVAYWIKHNTVLNHPFLFTPLTDLTFEKSTLKSKYSECSYFNVVTKDKEGTEWM